MVGTTPGSLSIGAQAGHSYTHEYLDGDGDLWPGWWLDYRAAGNLEGNWRVISTETEDVNAGVFPSPWADPPWTQAQLDKLIVSGAWKCARYNIPPELIPDTKPGRRGIAYHRQGIAGNYVPYDGIVPGGERWSNAFGKICPARRVHQLKTIVIPGIQAILRPPVMPPVLPPTDEEDVMRLVQFAGDDRWFAVYADKRFWIGAGFQAAFVQDHLKKGGVVLYEGTPENPQPIQWASWWKAMYSPVRPEDGDSPPS